MRVGGRYVIPDMIQWSGVRALPGGVNVCTHRCDPVAPGYRLAHPTVNLLARVTNNSGFCFNGKSSCPETSKEQRVPSAGRALFF